MIISNYFKQGYHFFENNYKNFLKKQINYKHMIVSYSLIQKN